MTRPSDDLDLNLAPGLPGPLLAPGETCVNPATLVPALRPPGLTPVEPTFASNREMVAALLAERREAIAKLALPAGAEVTVNMPWEDFERLCELALEPAAGRKEGDADAAPRLPAYNRGKILWIAFEVLPGLLLSPDWRRVVSSEIPEDAEVAAVDIDHVGRRLGIRFWHLTFPVVNPGDPWPVAAPPTITVRWTTTGKKEARG